ncbi:MAG: UDP-N-acetylglucosamine 4,6-dehydratase (inverting) [Candidatus Pacebacteria bacterium]|nr:UDP-N-acetylglucosamine 4,6-dehydratase (inverting) [Candidatus Paceibacterota bacterium]
MPLENKTILLTGGTGSFGQKFVETALKKYNPKSIRIFSRGEYLQWEMAKKFNDPRVRFFIGDVRDKDRVLRAMDGVDIVIHAAALKHVPIAEYNPIEAIKTNIFGTTNVIDAAINKNIKKAIFISTDKAVNPANLYGATKLCAEKLFIQANSYVGEKDTIFSCCRYGNVIGSRGSVIPLFLEQNGNGFFTITDERMSRFLINLDQGVDFVINSIDIMKGGEVFIPKLPSVKIIDLIKAINPELEIKVIGIRPGEKIHETLLTEEEAKHALEYDNYYIVKPENPSWNKEEVPGGRALSEGFRYSSDNNPRWFKEEEIKKIIQDFKLENGK